MVKRIYTITSESGIHARLATLLVNRVTPFSSEVILEYKEKCLNLKSIRDVMWLGILRGETIKITAQGYNAVQVISSIDEMMQKEGLAV